MIRTSGKIALTLVNAGLNSEDKPFIAAMDLIGCLNFAKVRALEKYSTWRTKLIPVLWQDFVVSGTASEKLFGMAESMWEADLEAEDLFETISQTMLNAVDRDAYSGWGVVVWVIEKVRISCSVNWRCCTDVYHALCSAQDKVTKRWLKARMD